MSGLLVAAVLASGCGSVPEPSPAAPPLTAANPVSVLPGDAVRGGPPASSVNPVPLEPPVPVLKGAAAVERANRQAVQEVVSTQFRRAKLVFKYHEGARYPIRLSPRQKAVVTFLPDEEFFDMTFPDDAEVFEVQDTAAGAGTGMRDALVLKCHGVADKPGVLARDQIVYLSTKRTYILDLTCQRTGNILVGFEDPAAGVRSEMPGEAARRPRARTISRGAPLENLDCRYTATGRVMALKGEQVSVCTDGRQTVVTLPSPREAGGSVPMPAIFADPAPNAVPSTNPETGSRAWIADRPLDEFELRYGDEAITVVRGGR